MSPEIAHTWTRKDLLGIAELEPREIEMILDSAESFLEVAERPIKKVPALRGKTVINAFFEPSTRTRTSFEIAGKWLSADTINFSSSGSATAKGESLVDTALNLQAMAPDLLIVRHQHPGVPWMLAGRLAAGVINGGDGAHEHPTQALLDALTIRQHKGRLADLKVAIVGDILHSRVVRSNIHLLTKMGAQVKVVGPRMMMPIGIDKMGVEVAHELDGALDGADVVMALRVQLERHDRRIFPSIREYYRLFALTPERLDRCSDDVIIMHPGPMNRGTEIDSRVADGPYSVILEQVSKGVAVRMAVLYLLSGMAKEEA